MTGSTRLLKNRIPGHFFVAQGCGESNHGVHAGSFDMAMIECGIEDYNLVAYSSILPRGSIQAEAPKHHEHGEVLYTIMAASSTETPGDGRRLTAGIAIVKVHDKEGKEIGGLVAEYAGNDDRETAEEILKKNLNEMFGKRKEVREKYRDAVMGDIQIIGIQSIIPKKKFGTAMVMLGFLDHKRPEA